MASAPAVVLLTIEEAKAQGQVTERIILHTAMGSAASFVAFAIVLGIVHAEHSEDWLNALVHPLWVAVGALLVAWGLALAGAAHCPPCRKRSLAQVFVLIACALLAVGIARMLAVPVFLTLFLMGILLASRPQQTLRYTNVPEGHWLLAIVLFVIVGASCPGRTSPGWPDCRRSACCWCARRQSRGAGLVGRQPALAQAPAGRHGHPATVGHGRIHGL
jgi:NhaP-type Na+/H+ or K+/H+ antiporter